MKKFTRIAAFLMVLAIAYTMLPADAQAASSIRLNKTKLTLYTGGTTTLKVSGTSRKVAFSSSRKSVATVSSKGKVTARKAGTAVITAKAGSKKMTCWVTVKEENPKLNKSKITLYTGGTATLKVSGTSRKVTFSSNRKSVATVSSKGKVTARKAGTAVITAKVGSKKVTCRVAIKKENLKLDRSSLTLTVGGSKTLKVTGTSRKVTWSSGQKSVAIVSSKGKVTTKKAGTAVITAKAGSKKVTCRVTVKEKVPAGTTAVSIYWNGEKTIKATGAVGMVEWESSNDSIVTVKSSGTNSAVLTGKKVGSTTITAKADGKIFKKYKIVVKMKTEPVTAKEKAIAEYALGKYEWPDTWYGNSKIKDTGFTVKDLGIEWADKPENQRLWNNHKRALATARKLLPGRDIHIYDVDNVRISWTKQKELKARGVRYVINEGLGISHDHGDIEKNTVAWIE